MAKKKAKHLDYYLIIDGNNGAAIRKYLSKVQEYTGIDSRTISKHFSRNETPYEKKGYTIYKTQNVDLKSYNKGNSYNLSSTEY